MGLLRLIVAIQLLVLLIINAISRNLFGLGEHWVIVEIVLGVLFVVDAIWFVVAYRASSRLFDERIAKTKARRDRLRQAGKVAEATIRQIRMGGMAMTQGVQRSLQVVLTLEVLDEGAASFEMELVAMISELHLAQYQPGKQVRIRFDPEDRENSELVV